MKVARIFSLFMLSTLLITPSIAQVISGAVPQVTQAEAIRSSEDQFQKSIGELKLSVDGIETRVTALDIQAGSPDQAAVKGIEKDIELANQQADKTATLSSSQMAQIQITELKDRLASLGNTLNSLKQRSGAGVVFGLDFFGTKPPVQNPDQWSVPADYRVRVKDKLRILILSNLGAQNEYHVTVSTAGRFLMPGVGQVSAAGKTIEQLNQLLSKKVSSKFKQLSVEVTVEGLSTIQVQVSGAVALPGTYSLPGMATVLNALHQAGGPTRLGTFRKMLLVRAGEPSIAIDLYDFLLNGSKKQDLPLRNGDLIFVPLVTQTATIQGEVVRPAQYEANFPITLQSLIQMAGGIKPTSYVQTIQVERVEGNQYRVLLSEPATAQGGITAVKLLPGDVVTVSSVQPLKTNQVEITGPVSAPGMYGLSDGMRVSELIKVAQGLAPDKEVYTARGDILRIDPLKGTDLITFSLDKALQGDPDNDVVLHKLDRVFLYQPDQVVFRQKVVTLQGAVAKPGILQRNNGMRVKDLIAAAGGVLPQAYLTRADLKRYVDEERTELVKVDVQGALDGNPSANIELKDRDELTVYTFEQVKWQNRKVRVEGAVQRPGEYDRADGMRVSDLIFMSGGLAHEASSGIEVSHAGTPGSSGPVKIDLASLKPSGDQDVILSDGDVVTVPSVNPYPRNPEVVYISGEVQRPGPYPVPNTKFNLGELIANAGGLTEQADADGLIFLRQKSDLDNKYQEREADILLAKMRIFADKEFQAQMAKLGMSLPGGSSPTAVAQFTQSAARLTNTGPESDGIAGVDSTAKAEPVVSAPSGPDGKYTAIAQSTRIAIDLRKALDDKSSSENLALRDGDRVYVPKLTNVVTVVGAVMQPRSFALSGGKTPSYYVERSGGYTPDASKSHVIVVRSNGEAFPKDRVRTIQSGDMIIVPSQGFIDVTRKLEKTVSITKVLADVLSSAYILTHL